MQLFMIVPWLVAAGLAYWKMETNSSKLSEFDTTMADEIKNDKDGSIKKKYLAALDDEKAKSKVLKEVYETLEKDEDKKKTDDGKKQITKAKEETICCDLVRERHPGLDGGGGVIAQNARR